MACVGAGAGEGAAADDVGASTGEHLSEGGIGGLDNLVAVEIMNVVFDYSVMMGGVSVWIGVRKTTLQIAKGGR